jgi:hypothetical protein
VLCKNSSHPGHIFYRQIKVNQPTLSSFTHIDITYIKSQTLTVKSLESGESRSNLKSQLSQSRGELVLVKRFTEILQKIFVGKSQNQ